MTSTPVIDPRVLANEAALTTLIKVVIELYGAVLDVASESTDLEFKHKISERAKWIAPLIDQAIEQITSGHPSK